MSDFQPDSEPKQNPRFEWKPKETSNRTPSAPDPNALAYAHFTRDVPGHNTYRDFNLNELRSNKLSEQQILNSLYSAGLRVPPAWLRELIDASQTGRVLEEDLFASYAAQMKGLQTSHVVSVRVGDCGSLRECSYVIEHRTENNESENIETNTSCEKSQSLTQPNNLRCLINKGALDTSNVVYYPLVAFDWNGEPFNILDTDKQSNWIYANRILGTTLPKAQMDGKQIHFSLLRYYDLSDFIDTNLSDQIKDFPILNFGLWQLALVSKPDLSDLSRQEATEDLPSPEYQKNPNEINSETIEIIDPSAATLARIGKELDLPLSSQFFKYITHAAKYNDLIEEDNISHELSDLGRYFDVTQTTKYIREGNQTYKQTEISLYDDSNPYGNIRFCFQGKPANNPHQTRVDVTIEIDDISNAQKTIDWTKLKEAMDVL